MIEEIKKRIREIAKEEGVDPDLAVKVAECESGFNLTAQGLNRTGSVDRGLYQWNDYWHPEISDICAFNMECSTRAFCRAVKDGHLSWWNASKSCWQAACKKTLLLRLRDLLRRVVALYQKLLRKY